MTTTLLCISVPGLLVANNKLKTIKGRCSTTSIPPFTENLTSNYSKKYNDGNLHQCAYNRDTLVTQIESKLSIPENSAILLHGLAGSGKTAIVEELIYRQVTGKSKAFAGYVFLKLDNSKIFDLQKGPWMQMQENIMGGGIKGTLDKLFDSLKGKKYILFIDEAHRILSEKFFEEKLEELARGEVKIIFATTTEQMKWSTSSWDDAMDRRVPKIEISEFSLQETIVALQEGLTDYEKTYQIKIDRDAIATIVALSSMQENPDKQNQAQKSVHFPHKSVHLLGEICSATKQKNPSNAYLSKDLALEYYASTYRKNKQELRNKVNKIIEEKNLNNKNTVFQQHVLTYTNEGNDSFAYPHQIKDLSVDLKNIFARDTKEAVVLAGSSLQVQRTLIGALSSDHEVARINLSQMIPAYDSLTPEQAKNFSEEFYKLCEKSQTQRGRLFIFHIEDGETLLDLLGEKVPFSPSRKNDSISQNLSDNHLVQTGQQMLEQGRQQLEKFIGNSIPKTYSQPSPTALQKSSPQNKQEVDTSKEREFIKTFISLLKEKHIPVIISFQKRDNNSQLIFNNLPDYEFKAIPDLNTLEIFKVLSCSYKRLPKTLIWQTLLCAIYYFDAEQNQHSTLIDIAYELLKKTQEILASKVSTNLQTEEKSTKSLPKENNQRSNSHLKVNDMQADNNDQVFRRFRFRSMEGAIWRKWR
jgi:hypothetical protein